jgi:hypothetical protein
MAIIFENGINIGPGIIIGNGSGGGGGTPGVDNVVGYDEMPPPVTALNQLQDAGATINSPIGFTINNDAATGVAIQGLTASNQAWFAANYLTVPGTYTCTWGAGSTVASSSITVGQLTGSTIVFTIQGQTGAATYNYPFTFS